MSAPGPRTAQIIALWQSGELASAARGTRTRAEWAAKLGMSTDALKGAIDGARQHGHAIPDYRTLALGAGDFTDEEPTRPVIGKSDIRPETCHAADQRPDFGHAAIGMHTATVPNLVIAPPNLGSAAQQPIAPGGETSIHQAQVGDPPSTARWPHVEAFDAVGGNDMLPAHGPGVRRSTLLRDGEPVLQWIKNPGGGDTSEIYEAAKRALANAPRAPQLEPPQYAEEDLLNCICVGDAHLGMLAWGRETGEPFNIEIAERDLVTAIDRLVALAPNASQSLWVNIGDWVHADSESGTTTKGTRVDVDSRWPRVMETAIRAKRYGVSGLLTKSRHVHDINVRGNHDSISSVVMSMALAQFYENEPRVTVDTSPGLFNYYRFGQTLLGFHHGHTTKPIGLAGVMAVRRAKDWGETKYRRVICGHYHSQRVHEVNGVIVEYIPTLASLDAWAAGQGYDAMREIRLDVIHREHGLIRRHYVGIGEIRALQEAS